MLSIVYERVDSAWGLYLFFIVNLHIPEKIERNQALP